MIGQIFFVRNCMEKWIKTSKKKLYNVDYSCILFTSISVKYICLLINYYQYSTKRKTLTLKMINERRYANDIFFRTFLQTYSKRIHQRLNFKLILWAKMHI